MELNEEILGHKREDYLSWDAFFMGIAKLAAGRSKDPSTQVGACIVSESNRILSIGYNGTPNGFNDNEFPWDRNGNCENETKYPYVCHAELNAILNYPGARSDLKGARVYVDLFPCNECAKVIIQSGISEIIYLSDKYNGTPGNEAAKLMLTKCGVKYKQLSDEEQVVLRLPLIPDEAVSRQ